MCTIGILKYEVSVNYWNTGYENAHVVNSFPTKIQIAIMLNK